MSYSGSESITISATPERIIEVVTDVEAYPDWMSAFRRAEVTKKDDQDRPKRAEFEVDARIKVVEYTLEYEYGKDRIAWKSVDGNVKKIQGSYSLTPEGGDTHVEYAYDIDPGFPVPGFLARQGVKMMVSTALGDLKRRAES